MHLKELDANLIVVLDALLIDASVTKAAERLGRSPSAVSHALSNLRHIFDDQLFVRAGQRLTPTVKAQELSATVHIIVSGLESLLRPTEPFDPRLQARTFYIACSELAELYLLNPLRSQIAAEAPSIQIERFHEEPSLYLDEMRHGRIDFAFIEGAVEDSAPDMQWRQLQNVAFQTLLPLKEGGAARRRRPLKVDVKRFQNTPHIISRLSGGSCALLEEAFQRQKLSPALLQKVTSSLLAALLAFERQGFVTIPKWHSDFITKHVAVTEVFLPFELPRFDLHLGWHRRFERDECHLWLREKFVSHFQAV